MRLPIHEKQFSFKINGKANIIFAKDFEDAIKIAIIIRNQNSIDSSLEVIQGKSEDQKK